MDVGEHSRSVPVSASFHGKRKLRKLRKFLMAVLPVVRLMKSMKRLCVDPAAVGVEPGPVQISTGPRKAQENLNYPSDNQYEYSGHLKLKFSNSVSGPIYTGLPVGDQEGSSLDLHLIDSRTHNIVNSGPEASAKVEIVVLEKDGTSNIYGGDMRSLIRGDPHVSLKDGTVSVSHISFKHTRVPMRKRELRLGARAVYPHNIGTRIMEAVTEPFFVKDRRAMGKSLKPLNLDDEVWKLQTIGKGGGFHNRLMKENIKTVRDFLTWYSWNREKLLTILGRRMHVKKLDAAVHQAKSKLDLKRYVYPSAAHSQKNQRVLFTDVGELIGVLSHESQFVSVQQLTPPQKDLAMEQVKTAFKDGHQNWKILDNDSFERICSSVCPLDCSSNGFCLEASCCPTHHTQQQSQPTFIMPSTRIIINNYDNSGSQMINSSEPLSGALPDLLDPYDHFNYQPLPASIWD
ncbi:hypothetical protein HAX54_017083 [Datura stramonium]|uniref:Calmodulin-binding protein 60 A-like n=1 Tax=Datura stramonium TaxID=4076 RepID=A0ABS8UMX8_DATST|nr:hypothetical protein [Datura stramonium]